MMAMRISVPIPVYNGAKYLPTQLDSILKQLSENDEIIISYNPSTDSTWDVIKKYEENNKNIKVYTCDVMGVTPNGNNALSHCSGKYILPADQDDLWLDGKVKNVVCAFEKSNAPIVLHDMRYADTDLNPTDKTMFAERGSRPGLLRNLIKNSYHGGCMAINASYLNVIYPVPLGVGFGDMWAGLVGELCGEPIFINKVLMLFRCHNHNLSSRNRRDLGVILPERLRLIKELYFRRKVIKNITREIKEQ